MKTITIITAFMFVSIFSYSQDWVEFSASESTSPNLTLSTSNDTIVEFEINVPGMYSTEIDSFNRIEILNHFRMDSIGFPEVPVLSYLVAIPSCDSVIINTSLLDSIRISDVNIYPAPELVHDTLTGGEITLVEQFSYDTTAYNTDDWFPGAIAEAMDKGAIRDQNVVRVLFYPVQFNPVDKEILAYSKVKIALTFHNASGSIRKDVGIFNEVVGNALINYNSSGLNASVSCGAGLEETGSIKWATSFPNDYVEDSCDYLIIVPSSFYTNTVIKNKIESLAQHRADFNGFNVVMTKTSSIYSAIPDSLYSELHEKIKELLKNTYENGTAYHTYDGKLAYVNLFGDVELQDGSPGIPTYSEGYDVYFTQVYPDEDDVYPDLMIGRCSVDTVTQVQNVVHKLLI
nr:hypothetical protein [Bacteroidota bacterium]